MSYLILILLSVVVAYLEATDDARDIANRKKIDHKKQVIERIIILGLIVGSLVFANRGYDGKWHWSSLLLVPICWAAFTISFRWMLNKLRGKDWRYVSFSNSYDTFWLFTFMRMERAGSAAYAFELFILTLSTWGYFTL